MGKITSSTVKKIALLYAINKAKKAIYSDFRLHKLIYFCTKDSKVKPFTYKHTDYGQYSYELADIANELESIGLIESKPLDTRDNGIQWAIKDKNNARDISSLLAKISPNLKNCIDNKFDTYQYMKQDDLDKIAHSDQDLLNTPLMEIIFSQNISEYVDVDIPENDIEDLELALNTEFVTAVRKLINRVDNKEINIEQWVEL